MASPRDSALKVAASAPFNGAKYPLISRITCVGMLKSQRDQGRCRDPRPVVHAGRTHETAGSGHNSYRATSVTLTPLQARRPLL